MSLFGGKQSSAKPVQGVLALAIALTLNFFVYNGLQMLMPQVQVVTYQYAALVGMGLLAIIGSIYLVVGKAVRWGLSLGGVILLFTSSMQYMGATGGAMDVLVPAVALAVLIWLGATTAKD